MMDRDISRWLGGLGLGKYADLFIKNDIDLSALPHISEPDLADLGLTIGARRRVMAAIAALTTPELQPSREAQATDTGEVPPAQDTNAERRQLTVMFCDLVGSTVLSSRLDPEDLRDVMRQYQDTVSGVVARYGGYVANFLGDGIVAYFGWPRADEDQALQAVRAGLASVAAVKDLVTSDGEGLSARVGLATGTVVVGDLVGSNIHQADAIVGETPNMAARLQGEAGPDEVVIGGLIRRLLGAHFALEQLGERSLRGLAEPVLIWRVALEITGRSRFDTSHAGPLTSFVGRDHELGLLIDRWEMAAEGEGQIVLISGEAGIGKSRLCQTFRERLRSERHLTLRYQCAPQHVNSPLYPSIQQLIWAAGIAGEDTNDEKLDKIEALINRTGDTGLDTTRLFGNLLGLSFESQNGALSITPAEIKQRTLIALAGHLVHLASRQPVLLIVEDVHWMDPSSAELFELVAGQIQTSPILVIMTHRPEWVSPFGGQSHIASLQLNRLGRRLGREMVNAVAGREISEDVVDEIVERTDGVPLFIEEVTRSLVETGVDPARLDIPATLQASLLARLDRLGAEAKEIAQAGAVIGRQFSREALARLSGLADEGVADALDRLIDAQLLYRLPNGTEYLFKHALVQDAAYQSLLRTRRRELHRIAADTAAATLERDGEGSAEVVAFHFAQAEAPLDAAGWWIRAGRTSARASATTEAISHFRNALVALETVAVSDRHQRLELDAWAGLGPLVMAAEGVGSAAAAEAYEHSIRLAEALGDEVQLFRSRFGTWHLNNVKGDARSAKRIADTLLQQATRTCDEDECLQAHHASWSTAWMRADFRHGFDQIDRGLALYDEERHADHKFVYGGHDPGVCCHMFASWHYMSTGNVDRALAETDASLRLSQRLEHPYSTSVAYLGTSISTRFLGLWDRLDRYSCEGIDLCLAHGLKSWLPVLQLSAASLRVHSGDDGTVVDGIALIKEAHDMWTGAGAGTFLPWFHYESACGHLKLGQLDEAAEAIDRAKRQCEINDERWLEPEILRVEAQLLRRSGQDVEAVGEVYATASKRAQELGANLTGFQTSLDHARMLAENGATERALRILAEDWGVMDTASRLDCHKVRHALRGDLLNQ
jgi:class 3 adenylate cyclase/tetratricopeptide (TPR) repeat protein